MGSIPAFVKLKFSGTSGMVTIKRKFVQYSFFFLFFLTAVVLSSWSCMQDVLSSQFCEDIGTQTSCLTENGFVLKTSNGLKKADFLADYGDYS